MKRLQEIEDQGQTIETRTTIKKRVFIIPFVIIVIIASIFYLNQFIINKDLLVSPIGTESLPITGEKRLDKYTVLNLGQYPAKPSIIEKEEILEENENYTSYLASFISDNKKVTAMLNIPHSDSSTEFSSTELKTSGADKLFPAIVMFRGYVDPEIYQTGVGTERAGSVFAQNGYITFAPDFLGYGESEMEAENVMESRFETYTVALDALSSIKKMEGVNESKIGIWAHSNGGQIALTILEATQKDYPTVLWAPVSKPFPYSILYFTDEAEDKGKFLRAELAKFESNYDADLYSITDYFNRIKAPIQLHQGTEDEAVPYKWSDELEKNLLDAQVEIDYYLYPGADHNLMPSWNSVVNRNLEFYNSKLTN